MSSRFRLGLVLALLLTGCATSSTRFVSTWRSPTARPVQPAGQKVVAMFMGQNDTTRHVAEDTMVRELVAQGAEGVPAYAVLGDQPIDEQTARQTLRDRGFDGMVVMRIIGQETQTRYEPTYWGHYPHYRRLWGGYWGWGWRHVHDPGYLVQDRILSVETLVYSLDQNELLWAGVSRTFNPADLESFVGEVAHETSEQLARAGLVASARR
jgi:hypothetical protein